MISIIKVPLVCVAIALFGLLAQSSLLQLFPVARFFAPNILLCLTVYLALFEGTLQAALLVFFLGVLLDLHSGIFIGPWAAAFLLVFGCVSVVAQRLLVESAIALSMVAFACVAIASIVYGTLNVHGLESPSQTIFLVVGEACGSALLMPFLTQFVRRCLEGRRSRFKSGSLLRK